MHHYYPSEILSIAGNVDQFSYITTSSNWCRVHTSHSSPVYSVLINGHTKESVDIATLNNSSLLEGGEVERVHTVLCSTRLSPVEFSIEGKCKGTHHINDSLHILSC